LLVMALLPSGILAPWAPGIHGFRGRIPVAHTLAGLRIAVTVTRTGARPCFRPAGLGFGRVGFSPTGRHTEFQSVSPPPSFRTSLAWSLPISPVDIRQRKGFDSKVIGVRCMRNSVGWSAFHIWQGY